MKYCRLAREERYQIQALVESGLSARRVAKLLDRAPSTVCRELHRGKRYRRYCAQWADARSHQVRCRPLPHRRKLQGELKAHLISKLRQKWSPEQICGRLRLIRGFTVISTPTIYKYLDRDKQRGGELWKHLRILRRQAKDRKKATWHPKEHLPGRIMIEQRPKIVEHRNRIGDFERDTVRGKFNSVVLLTLVDRTSRLLKIARLPKATSQFVHEATVKELAGEPVKTITNDNGTEFSLHRLTAEALGAPIYFSNAYRSWERGTNENTNGLLRQYFPKRTKKDPPPEHILKRIEREINSRPRKCLGYRTPLEIHEQLRSAAVALAT